MLASWLKEFAARYVSPRTRPVVRRCRLEVSGLEERMVPAGMYDVAWLGHLSPTDNFSAAQGINDQGQVVGDSWVQDANGIPTLEKAFYYTPGASMTDLGTLNGNAAYAWDINNAGKTAGWYHFPSGGGYYEWAAIWDNGVGHSIPGYNQIGGHSRAFGVNDNGLVVGNADVPYPLGPAGNSEAFKYDGTTLTFLGTLGGKWSYGMDINNANYIAGFADTGENPSTDPNVYISRYHATIWSPSGVIKDLGTLGTDSYAYKINATGQAVGSSIATDGFYHAFYYDGTRMIDIGTPNSNTEAFAINNAGQIVGDTVNWLNSSAFLYENGTTYDLNTMVNGLGTDTIMSAHDINNLGQIVGYGLHNGQYEAFVLTPGGGSTNGAPSANTGGPYTIVEGSSFTLDASLSSDPDGDPLTYSWDVNGDGVFGDTTGVVSTLTWADLQNLGIAAGNTYTLSLQVNDAHGHIVTASTSLTVDFASFTASVSDPTDGFQGVTGQTRTVTLGAIDPLPTNGFEFRVEWGDGTYDTLHGQSGLAANHVYAATGAYNISVTAKDDEGFTSSAGTTSLYIQRAEQQGNVLALGGTPADDTITLSAGTTSGTIVTAFGTFTTGQVMVYGDKGSDRVIVQGTAVNDSFGINPDAVAINGFFVQGTSVENWTADGLAGNDTFYLNGAGLPISVMGGDGNDSFKLSSYGAVNGRVDGGAGSDILDYALFHNQATVNLSTQSATGTLGIANIEGFVGSNLADTLIGTNATSTWAMNGYNSGTVNGVQFGSFENWVGGSGTDTFVIANARYISGIVDGGAGINTLDYSGYTTTVVVDLSTGTATNVRGGIANIANVYGGAGSDTLTGSAGDNILLGNAGNDVLNGGISGNDVLVGGAGNDNITGSSGRNILIGGLGTDVLLGGVNEDILIGGTTSYDANVNGLTSLMSEWKRTDLAYLARIDHLTGKTKNGANGSFTLTSKTVKDDGVADLLTGGDGLDWFWGLTSEIKDLKTGERRN